MLERRDYIALDWVAVEVGTILRRATDALAAYQAEPADQTQLRFCLSHVHSVCGTLRMVEMVGASLWAEEIERVLQALLNGQLPAASHDDAFAALAGSLSALPAHLERLRRERRDHPAALLSPINELRAVRNAVLPTEGVIFCPAPMAAPLKSPSGELWAVAPKLRQMYQLALVNYLRDIDPRANLNYLAKVFARLARLTEESATGPLWDIAIALCEGLMNRSVERSAAVKLLLRQLDAPLKALAEGREVELPQGLAQNLLYYVATSAADTRFISEIKQCYALADALPDPSGVATPGGRQRIETAFAAQLHAIATLLAQGDTSDGTLIEIKRAHDAAALLGHGEIAARLQGLQRDWSVCSRAGGEARLARDGSDLAALAAQLEELPTAAATATGRTLFNNSGEAQEALDGAFEAVLRESRNGLEQAKEAVIEFVANQWRHECLDEVPELLLSVRGSLTVAGRTRAAAVLAACEQYVRQDLLSQHQIPAWQLLDTLADAIASIDYYLERLGEDAEADGSAILDVAEESVRRLGYPLLAVESAEVVELQPRGQTEDARSGSNPVTMESVEPDLPADTAVAQPAADLCEPEQSVTGSESAIEPQTPSATESPTEAIFEIGAALDTGARDAVAPAAVTEAGAGSGEIPAAGVPLDEEDAPDPEIVEIFIEEAGEVLETLAEHFPRWAANAADSDSLTVVRRSFHTLKGSGRMVGATDIGELAWSIENMLNRVIDGTVAADAARTDTIRAALAEIPGMVSAFAVGQRYPMATVESLIARAESLAKEQAPTLEPLGGAGAVAHVAPADSGRTSAGEASASVVEESDAAAPARVLNLEHDVAERAAATVDLESLQDVLDDGSDAQLLEIFAIEAASHMAVLADFVAAAQAAEQPLPLSDDLQRAMHTLKGSAYMAGVASVVQIISPAERLVKALRAAQRAADGQVLSLLNHALLLLQRALDTAGDPPGEDEVAAFAATIEQLLHEPIAADAQSEPMSHYAATAALSGFLSDALEQLSAVAADLQAWQAQCLAEGREQTLASTLAQVAENAEANGLVAVTELAAAAQAVCDQGAELARPDPLFFELAMGCVDRLVDMLDQIAAEQQPVRDEALVKAALDAVAAYAEAASSAAATELPVAPVAMFEAEPERTEREGVEPVDAEQEDADSTVAAEWAHDLEPGAAVDTEEGDEEPLTEVAPAIGESPAYDAAADRETGDAGAAQAFDESLQSAPAAGRFAGHESAHPLPAARRPDDGTLASGDDDEVDADILEIFLEEADDLLEGLDSAIHEWMADRSNEIYVDELQRLLHTLKGGARLAGLRYTGNVAHDFETLLTQFQQSGAAADEILLGAVQRFQDRLVKCVESIKGQGPAADAALADQEAVARDEGRRSHEEPSPRLAARETAGAETTGAETTRAEADDTRADQAVAEAGTAPLIEPRPDSWLQPIPARQRGDVVPFVVPSRPATAVAPSDDTAEAWMRPGGAAGGGMEQQLRRGPQEVVKIPAQQLELLVNLAGETSIARSRTEEQVNEFVHSLDEMQITAERLQEQVRRLDLETEAQVLFRREQVGSEGIEGFDPLEFDRYSLLQQLSRSLLESASDLIDLKSTLSDKARDMETLLVQQSRINTELQEGLMRSRMVPFARMVPRLRRIVRQVAGELGKDVDFQVENAEGEMDRTVLERIVAPLEHMLRNAVDHGIESTADRLAADKPARGRVLLGLGREGGEVVLTLTDDGRGIDLAAVRRKAIKRGLMAEEANLSDHEVLQFILQAGFSTAEAVTQISGRGVGMDVVYSEIKQLGGNLEIDSEPGQGTRFTVRLPFTVSVNRALMVNVGGDVYAIPLNTIEGIVRVSPFELEAYYQPDAPLFEYAGQPYLMRYMGALLRSSDKPQLEGQAMPLPVVLVRATDHSVAVQVDGLLGSREIVVKTLGPQFGQVQGLSGATVLGDGSVVVILDLLAMIRADASRLHRDLPAEQPQLPGDRSRPLMVMVVDDSVTVRKVTSRFLEREGMEVVLAKDGLDAIALLNEIERVPDVMLLDIEMPRMDGFEVASRVRHTSRLRDLPIIMITSRTGDKHRERAFSLGVNKYLGKPYQESQLLESIQELTGATLEV